MPAVDVAHSLVLDGPACARDQGAGRRERGEGPSRTPSPPFPQSAALVGSGGRRAEEGARAERDPRGQWWATGGNRTARSATLEGGGGWRAEKGPRAERDPRGRWWVAGRKRAARGARPLRVVVGGGRAIRPSAPASPRFVHSGGVGSG